MVRRRLSWLALSLLSAWEVSACETGTSTGEGPVSAPVPAPGPERPGSSAPASQLASPATAAGETTAERRFGAPLSATGAPMEVGALLRDPAPFVGKSVKTQGVVARVCERAGCWLELQPEAGGPGLRVPMADHAFTIPQDALGRPAIVEGELKAEALSPSHRSHLEGEGAKSVGPLALSARAVVVR